MNKVDATVTIYPRATAPNLGKNVHGHKIWLQQTYRQQEFTHRGTQHGLHYNPILMLLSPFAQRPWKGGAAHHWCASGVHHHLGFHTFDCGAGLLREMTSRQRRSSMNCQPYPSSPSSTGPCVSFYGRLEKDPIAPEQNSGKQFSSVVSVTACSAFNGHLVLEAKLSVVEIAWVPPSSDLHSCMAPAKSR